MSEHKKYLSTLAPASLASLEQNSLKASEQDERTMVKIHIHDQGGHSETLWTEVVQELEDGAKLVRLKNISALRPWPTYDDIIEVKPSPDGVLEWDQGGVPFNKLESLIHTSGGRYPVVLDYEAEDMEHYLPFAKWLFYEQDMPCESTWPPSDGDPGRLFVVAKETRSPPQVMDLLSSNPFGFTFVLLMPKLPDQ